MNNVINVSITIDSDQQLKDLSKLDFDDVYFTIFDERRRRGKKDAWALKNQYGAQLNPFIEIKINEKFYHMIYSEASESPISDLNKVLKRLIKIKDTLNS